MNALLTLAPFLLLAGCLLMEAFYSGSEIASYAVNRIRIRYWAEEGRPGMRLALFLLERHPLLVITTLVGTNLSVYLSGRASYALTSRYLEERLTAELVATLWLTPVVFLLAEVLPKWLFRRRAERLFPASARLLAASLYLYYPLVRLLAALARLARLLAPGKEEATGMAALERAFSRQGLREYGLTGVETGAITRGQYALMETVLVGMSRPVEEYARPLAFLPVVRRQATAREAILEAARRGRSAALVASSEGGVAGLVYLYDLAAASAEEPVEKYLRPADQVPKGTPLGRVVERMRSGRRGVSVVKDEDGGVLGALFLSEVVEVLLERRP